MEYSAAEEPVLPYSNTMKSYRTFTSVCVSKRRIAPNVYELHTTKPEDFSFQPGQFVLFDVPSPTDPHDMQTRAYSIASAPSESEFLFVIKLVPNGRASVWIEKILEAGTTIPMHGPFGAFTLLTDGSTPVVMIATGTGVAPFRSQLLWLLQTKHDQRTIHLLFGVVSAADLFWAEEWKALESSFPNFHAHLSCLSGEADWHGESGSIQERVSSLIAHPSDVRIYICGAPSTVQELKDVCQKINVPKENIHAEKYV